MLEALDDLVERPLNYSFVWSNGRGGFGLAARIIATMTNWAARTRCRLLSNDNAGKRSTVLLPWHPIITDGITVSDSRRIRHRIVR